MLPAELAAFSRLPIWNVLFLLLAMAVAGYSAWSLVLRRQRQDLYYLLAGLFLAAGQLLIVFPPLDRAVLLGQPVAGSSPGILLAVPAALLFVLGVRAR